MAGQFAIPKVVVFGTIFKTCDSVCKLAGLGSEKS